MPLTKTDIDPPTLTDFGLTEAAVSSSREIISRINNRFGMLVFGLGATVFLCFFGFLFASAEDLGQAIVEAVIVGTVLAPFGLIVVGLLLIPVLRWALPNFNQAQGVLKLFEQGVSTVERRVT